MTEGSELVKFRVILLKGLHGRVVRAWAFHSVGQGSNPKGTLDFSCSSGLCLHGLPSRVVNLHISHMQFIFNICTMYSICSTSNNCTTKNTCLYYVPAIKAVQVDKNLLDEIL